MDIVSALRMVGYDHEDGMISFDEGVKKDWSP
jgi:hypothetical protein